MCGILHWSAVLPDTASSRSWYGTHHQKSYYLSNAPFWYLHYSILSGFIEYLFFLKLCIFIFGITGRNLPEKTLIRILDCCLFFTLYSIWLYISSLFLPISRHRQISVIVHCVLSNTLRDETPRGILPINSNLSTFLLKLLHKKIGFSILYLIQ